MNVVHRIAEWADIDTRRAMGFPPKKLDPKWKSFVPRPRGTEIFRYDVRRKILSYYEFWMYNHVYSEVVTRIMPENAEEHSWRYLPRSVISGTMFSDVLIERYQHKTRNMPLIITTAGWPEFIH